MKRVSKYKIEKTIIIPLLLFALISILTIYSADSIFDPASGQAVKQAIWYGIGFGLSLIVMTMGNKFIYNYIYLFYGIGIIGLVGLLIFAPYINGARAWYQIGSFTLQPSEFMKIILILTLAVKLTSFNEQHGNPTVKDEFILLLQIAGLVGLPSLLTFLQPDTGVVLIYILITVTMLFISGVRYRWFLGIFGIGFSAVAFVLILYFNNPEAFIDILGNTFFLRVDRLLEWTNQSGYQLENAVMSVGSSGIYGHGIHNIPVYYPESTTDFVFSSYASTFGFLGTGFLISLITFFDIKLINVASNSDNTTNKLVISGIIGMLLYQQVQNIGMTVGLLPITGITLPFISYGGSSLLSYMIMAGIIFNISNNSMRYTNKKTYRV